MGRARRLSALRARFSPATPYLLVRARVEGPAGARLVQALLDTGATTTTIRPSVLSVLGVDTGAATEHFEIASLSGIERPPVVTVTALTALGVEVRGMRVLAFELPGQAQFDAILGLDFMRGHRLVLDFREGVLEFD